ncbi:MAG: hypothetical protein IPM35_02030 [Myxococcales bacterium]|nr:hypothetical protein [Myxococcales bacterium]
MTRLAKLLVALPLLAASCATATDQPEIATRVSAIAVPGLTPVPCCAKTAPKNVVCGVPSSTTGNVESKWDGTQIDLVVADAFAACMMDPVTGQFATAELGTDYTTDDYLQQIKAHIAHAAPKNSPPWKSGIDNRPWYQAWIELRAERLYNCDPITLTNNQAVILEPVGVKERIVNPTASPALDQASGLLRVAGVNLCIAQKMRQLAPGASSGEALLLGEAEQRQLLDTIRQRVQIAMLHYAALGVLFSAPRNPGATGLLASVQTWAAQCADNAIPGCSGDPRAHLFAMGRDFAAAVQLHVAVSEELLSLLARSRGARLPTDRVGQNRGDELWGAGSWYQRLLAAAFGGQALAVRDDGPWLHPTGSQQPGDVPYASGKGLPGWGFDWPEYSAHPHFQRDVLEPQVWELWSLARSHDAVRLVVQEESCNALLEQESADFLYKSVETQLRKDTCFKPVTGGPCGSGGTCGVGFNCDDVTNTCTGCETSDTVLEPTLAFPNEKYVLWEQHRITPQHARQLVEFLIRAVDYAAVPPATDITYPGQLPPICNGGQWWAWPMAEDKSIDTRAGAVNATRSLTFESMTSPTGKVLHIHRDEVFAQRSLEDDAPRFTRYGTQTFMAPWEVNPLVTYGWAGQGPMPGLTNHFRDASLGSVSALAATRQMLMWSMAYLTDKAYTQQTFPELPRLTDYFAEGRRVIETINGAIGTSSVNVRPALEVKGDTLLVAEFVPEPSVFRSTYYVEGTYGADDAFWQAGPGVAWGVCAAHSPLAGNLVSAPTISLYGQTLEQVINLAYGNHECGLVLPQNPTLDSYYGAT